LSRKELAERLGIKPNAIRQWVKYGLPIIRDDQGRSYFYMADVTDFLKQASSIAPEAEAR
jgi:DNA-binding transcriptional MerR regulator